MKYNIALFGTFNVENYGDLMFPVIFKKAMEKRGLDFNLFLFSPEKTCAKALDESTMVYAAEKIDEIHSEFPIDAVVVGGGALVHYNNISVKFPNSDEYVDYDISQSWYSAIEFATRHNIKLIFNLPQIPFPFPDSFKEITRAAFDKCDYISFRDNISKQYLLDLYGGTSPKIDVFPDSVCCIADLININELEQIKFNILQSDYKYAVIQFNPQKPESDDEYLIKIINSFKEKGLETILLPIGYTHNDDLVLEEFNQKYSLECKIIDRKLNILETAAILAGCEIYIGSSFHGAITSIAYGKKAISYNYIYPKNKNNEIFSMYNISEFVADDAKKALDIVVQLLENKTLFNPDLSNVLNQLNDYFNTIHSIIVDDSKNKPKDYFNFSKPIFKILPLLSTVERKLELSSSQLESQKAYSTNLENIVAEHLTEIKRCSAYISDLEKHCKNLEDHTQDLKNYCQNLEKNNQDQNDYIISIEKQLHSTADQLNELGIAYSKLRNNFLVRCICYINKIFKKR